MSPIAQKYRDLTLRLLEARARHLWSEDQETALLDEMDSVWWQLTEVERSEADEWLATRREAGEQTGQPETEAVHATDPFDFKRGIPWKDLR